MAPRSKVEISGLWARHYDLAMDLLFLGRHRHFMRAVVDRMEIEPGDEILDLGSGTGRNTCLMMELLGPTGRVVGMDTSEEMLGQSRRRCRFYPQVDFMKARIEQPLEFHEEFDKVSLFFVLHGFEDNEKERIIRNARKALKPGGTLWVLDYDEFKLDKLWFPLRWAFTHLECELAVEFLKLDLKGMLGGAGFGDFVSYRLFRSYVRLLGARKLKEAETRGVVAARND